MIHKHVDLIAITLLLGAMAICSHARNMVVLGLGSSRSVWLAPQYRGSHIAIPQIPRIPFSRD